MKIAIAYPPLESKKGIPFLGQNRQFQWGKRPWFAYPMVPAYAATMLKNAGHTVVWLDGIAGQQTYQQWFSNFQKEKQDLVLMETKTPVIKQHWEIINNLKKTSTASYQPLIVLAGDHVTAFPKESFAKSKVDYVLTGGDYDFLLLNLVDHLTAGKKLEPGIWYRQGFKIRNSGQFQLNHDLNKLPFVDRNLTQWQLYAYKNSNYSRKPGTYTMFARDCWWGKCKFCSWTTLYPQKHYRVMSPKRALDEIGNVLARYPVKEIMDDSGTFPVGDWLKEFCQGMIKRKYYKKIKFDGNMRFNNGLSQKDYQLMAKAGFRFLLFGLESANQKTLDRINKNLKINQVSDVLEKVKKAGLWSHVTVMIGYPWETKKETLNTLDFAQRLFQKGLVDSLQATIVIPYPGTPLFEESKNNGWLKTENWNNYDMRESVMTSSFNNKEINGLVRSLYSSFWTPEFFFRKLKEGLTSWDRFRYYVSFAFRYFGKLWEFK